MMLRLGIIGGSPGNGHPFSWAAICNGYNSAAMATCPYPSIPRYLAERKFPEDRLADVHVTHVWMPDIAQSRHIAQAGLIPNVVDHPESMIGLVDGLLLARDDAENHASFALPYLKAGIPVYIDKPFALRRSDADKILSAESYPGQIFTGTAVAWAAEMTLSAEEHTRLGKVRHVYGVAPKYWATYAVHIIEPALQILDILRAPDAVTVSNQGEQCLVAATWKHEGLSAQFATLGNLSAPISLKIYSENGFAQLTFSDSFTAFRTALSQFCDGVRIRERRFNLPRTLAVTAILEQGCLAT